MSSDREALAASTQVLDALNRRLVPAADGLAAVDLAGNLETVRQQIQPRLGAVIDAVLRDAIAGGRHSDTARRFVLWAAAGWMDKDRSITINVNEQTRQAVRAWESVEGLDERGTAEIAARFLRLYLEQNPQERGALWGLLGVREAVAS